MLCLKIGNNSFFRSLLTLWDCSTTFTSEPLSLAALTGPLGTDRGPPGTWPYRWLIITELAARSEQVAAPAGAHHRLGRRTARPPTPRVFPRNVNFQSHRAGTATHPSPAQRGGAQPRRAFRVTIHKFHPRMPRKDVPRWCAELDTQEQHRLPEMLRCTLPWKREGMESYTAASQRARCERERRGTCSALGTGMGLLTVHLQLSQLNKYYAKHTSLDRNVSSNPMSKTAY